MSVCFFTLAVIFLMIGLVVLFSPEPILRGPARLAAPLGRGFARRNDQRASPVQLKQAQPGGQAMKLDWIKVGQRLSVQHPIRGELKAQVLGRVVFAELWQQRRGAEVPWTPTGKRYAGFWLEGDQLLLNWQNRFYLLEESTELSDADIQRDFLPQARKFAQSDQTANIYFSYPPAVWHIDDIGKFRVEEIQGSGLKYQLGGVGRFIHASGDSQRALVVEDFEGGSGQDLAWNGYQVEEQGIQKI